MERCKEGRDTIREKGKKDDLHSCIFYGMEVLIGVCQRGQRRRLYSSSWKTMMTWTRASCADREKKTNLRDFVEKDRVRCRHGLNMWARGD